MSTTLGVSALGVRPLAGTWPRAAPSVTITAPGSTVTSTTTTFSFTYTSPVSRAQYSYQAQLRTQDGGTVLFDTGTVVSTGTSALPLTFLLSDGSTYQLWVRASDLYDTGAWAVTTFTAQLADVNSYPDNTQVGSVYEIAINGDGFMLANHPERPYRRSAGVLDPPRFATGDTPFSEAIERYTLIGKSDWSSGAGQRFADRIRSDNARFWESEGINPFNEDDSVTLLQACETELSDTYTLPYAVVASNALYVCTADGELSSIADPGDTPTVFSITGAAQVDDMTSDGTFWYYADGANIYRNNTAADVAAWSTLNAYKIDWASDRIAIAYDSSGDAVFSTLADDGTEEVVSGRATHANATITDITSGNGFTFYAVQRNSGCVVMAWQNGSTDAPFVSLVLPAGQSVSALGFYLGNVFIRATEIHDGKTTAIIYRGVPVEGRLTAERILEIDDAATDHSVGDFSGDDRFVYFSWRAMTAGGRSGVGCIDLSTGGYATWLYADNNGATGNVLSIVQWDGLTAFTVAGYGTVVETATFLTTGTLKASHHDLGTSLVKIVDDVSMVFDPLPANVTVSARYSIDGGGSYSSVGPAVLTAGTKTVTWTLSDRANVVGLEFTLTSNGTSTPTVRTTTIRVHPLSLSDQILTLPVNCADRVAGLNGHDLPYRTTGMQRARALESLLGSRIRLQDVDWPVTKTAQIWEVVGAEYIESNHTFSQHKNRQVQSGVCVLTLRRGL